MKHDSDILKRIKSYFMRRKSSQEAHAFERESERDAFLYEAMEGFEGMLTSDIQQAMDELDDRLDEKAKRIVLPVYFKPAASVAALIAVSGMLWFTVFRSSDLEPDIANENQSEERYQPRDAQQKFDSMGQIAMDADTSSLLKDSLIENAFAVAEPFTTQSMPSPTEEAMKSEVISKLELASDDRVVVSEETEMDAAFNDIAAAVVEADEEAVSELEMEPEKALSQDLKSAPVSSEISRSKVSEKMVNNGPQPRDGWASYNGYLQSNLNSSENMPSGKVTLSFQLDRNGRPKKIVVTKSLCTACDAEAIRLISNGPAWKSEDKKANGSVSVTFP